jgi:hypothetical protein
MIRRGVAAPPWKGMLMTERVLELTPLPHFSVQVERPDQVETLASMGQLEYLKSTLHVEPLY